MKKKLIIILSLILVLSLLAGCSRAELEYLDMSSQLSSAEEFRATGTITGEINFDALAALVDKTMAKVETNSTYTGYSEGQAKDSFSEAGLTGTKNIKIDYDMLVDRKSGMSLWADFDVTFNGKRYEMGDMYFDAADGIYVSKTLLIGLYDFYKDVSPNQWDSYFYSAEYRNELLKALGDSDYVSMKYMEDASSELAMEIDNLQTANKEVNEEAVKFITTAFSGFTTGTVSSVSGGYRVSFDGNQGKKLIADVLQYAIDNTDKIISAYKDFFVAVLENMSDLTAEEKKEAIAEIDELLGQNNQIMISSYLAMARQGFMEIDKAGYLDFLNGFKYNETLKKSGNKYISQQDVSLTDLNKSVFSFKTQTEVTLQQVDISLPAGGTSLDTVQKAVTALEKKYNPVKIAELTWWNSDYGYEYAEIGIDYERAKESPFASSVETNYESYFVKDKRLYVPLRSISEGLGEQVNWDQKVKKAYVSRGGQQIYMTGIIKDGRTYIKVIDFEKLGYKVAYEYDKESGMHTAKISK
jgi:Copper amine oxidase N-terminal domain.